MEPNDRANSVAVFIDVENLIMGYGGVIPEIRLGALVEAIFAKTRALGLGTGAVVLNAYANWGKPQVAQLKRDIGKTTVEAVNIPSMGETVKNAADIQLIVDAMEVAYTDPDVTTIVIVSCDGGYVPLVRKLRRNKKFVIAATIDSDEYLMSEALSNNVDHVFRLDVGPTHKSSLDIPNRESRNKVDTFPISAPAKQMSSVAELCVMLDAVLKEGPQFIVDGDGIDGKHLGALSQRLRAKLQFDTKTMGYSSFTELIEKGCGRRIIPSVPVAAPGPVALIPSLTPTTELSTPPAPTLFPTIAGKSAVPETQRRATPARYVKQADKQPGADKESTSRRPSDGLLTVEDYAQSAKDLVAQDGRIMRNGEVDGAILGSALRARWPRVSFSTFGFESLDEFLAKECGLEVRRTAGARIPNPEPSTQDTYAVSPPTTGELRPMTIPLRDSLEAVDPAIFYPKMLSITKILTVLIMQPVEMQPVALLDRLGENLPDVSAEQIRLTLALLYAVEAFRENDDSSLILTSDIKSVQNGIDLVLGDARRRAETLEIDPDGSTIHHALFG